MDAIESVTEFGAWIDSAIEGKGMSLKALAIRAGVGQSTLSMQRAGTRAPSRDMVERLAAALGIDPAPGLRAAGFLPEGDTTDDVSDAEIERVAAGMRGFLTGYPPTASKRAIERLAELAAQDGE